VAVIGLAPADRGRRTQGVLCEGFGFLEGIRWREHGLYFSDIASGAVHRADPSGQVETLVEVPGSPSGLGFLPGGDLAVVSMESKQVMRFDGTELSTYARLEHLAPARLNDMVVRDGHAYVTNFGYDSHPRTATSLIHVAPDGTASMAEGELWRPNGVAVSEDRSTLVVAETRINRLTEFDIDGAGRPVAPRVFAQLPKGGWADGICLDAAGAVWVADPMGQRCVRVERGGAITDVIDTSPTPSITCTLGGLDGRRLFIVTSELGNPHALLPKRQARVEWIDVEVPGVGSP
jgi:sugar lactone lactonase YvrE